LPIDGIDYLAADAFVRRAKRSAKRPGRMRPAYEIRPRPPTVKSSNADPNSGMARLRRLFDNPIVLADDPSSSTSLASLPGLALPHADSHLVPHVGWHGRADELVAQCNFLFDSVDLGSCRALVCDWHLHLFNRRGTLQLGTTQRSAGSSRGSPRRSTGNHRYSLASPPPCLSRPSLRNAGLEHGHRPRSLLAAHGVIDCDRSGDDPDGGCGVGKALRCGVRRVSSERPRSPPETAHMIRSFPALPSSIDIIRLS
jgi:hypothetical protein